MDDVLYGSGSPIPVNADPLGITGGGKAAPEASAGAAPPRARPAEAGSVSAGGAPGAATDNGAAAGDDASPVGAAPVKVPVPPTKPVVVPNKAGKPSPAPSAVAPSGNVFIHLSAQKSEDAAKSAYQDLQAKYPGILGKLDADIQRVELGDKSVYYRVRIGPIASADAQNICGAYKSAGGDCRIAQY